MNERIKQLAEQNGFIHNWMPPGEQYELLQRYEKFAELIVKECAEIVEETRWMVPPSQEQIARSIKQHFGVEE